MAAVGTSSWPPRQAARTSAISPFPKLPAIPHPISRLGDPETISLRGYSRLSAREPDYGIAAPPVDRGEGNRSLMKMRDGNSSPGTGRDRVTTPLLYNIPEGVKVTVAADSDKPRLPIFGQRTDLLSRADSHRSQDSGRSNCTSRPGTQFRIEVDELEHLLQEKMRSGGYFPLRQLFRNNDPEGKGQVNRDVLLVILTKFLGRFITPKQFQQLLLRLRLHEKNIIKFEELYATLRDPAPTGIPTWLDPVSRKPTDRQMMTASQVHAQLKEKAKQRFLDLAELLPQKNPGGATRILVPEFHNMLNHLGYSMEDEEFEKLWKRYDTEGTGVIKGDVLLKRLGIEFRNPSASQAAHEEQLDPSGLADEKRQCKPLSKNELERKASINIEKWLKDRFREGFKAMKEEFERCDSEKTGKVQREDFFFVLAKFDLHLKEEHFKLFLARCGLQNSPSGVSYVDFLRNFQDRSDKGIPHKILSNSKHRFHRDGNISPATTVTAIEAKLANMFHSDFLSLLGTFHKIDKLERNVISQQEFQAAIESRFGVEISDEEFELLLDRIPLDEDGNVKYPQFMAMFDSRQGVPSLFDDTTLSSMTAPKRENKMHPYPALIPSEKESKFGRTPEQLFKIIKNLLHKNYQAVEKEFEDLDEINSRRLSQETMYLLLKRFDIQPEVTRGEIRRLWETLITNQDKTLDFLQFVRHFGYSPKSACFPNAKLSPPKKGDDDFKIRSKKLNCDTDILVDRVRAKVEYLWDDLRREFLDLDPYHTGFVSKEEFRDILTELCVHLNEYECDVLEKKFEINGDGRVSYLEFLKPFEFRKRMRRHGDNMAAVLQNTHDKNSQLQPGNQSPGLDHLTSRLRTTLQGEWKTLQRAFKKLDNNGTGFLSLPEFRSVLKLCNVMLDEDEVYHIMSKCDPNMDGHIDYKTFVETYRKVGSPAPSRSVTVSA
ncbi:EF-hand calcium-binding domain-containing protein 6-like [Protopterus annectens]|uniref:EF-hand calcium-binding domain-containing protein 6-like n=1 Tax=Protopterus annectens TaxID=7888 RepID=UPI001CF98378|nr:EF-hand calcium-binding domain-containing protein 6-like [Protopterus annectens]